MNRFPSGTSIKMVKGCKNGSQRMKVVVGLLSGEKDKSNRGKRNIQIILRDH